MSIDAVHIPRQSDAGRLQNCALRRIVSSQGNARITRIPAGAASRAVLPTHQGIATALTPNACARLIKRYCRKIGFDPANYSGHSMRSGYVTSAIEVNAPLLKIAEQTRHASFDMLRIYNRRVDLFREHSGAGFL